MPETIVMLHGFGGTHRAWDGVVAALDPESYRPVALDLPGHGVAVDAERPITFAGCAAHVLTAAPDRFALCGYSLGGRIALNVALAAPERVSRLVLISSSPGIDDSAGRSRRREADEILARLLEENDFEDFIERWRRQSLFAGDPTDVGELAREDLRRNHPHALAAVMRGIGTGEMTPLWGELSNLAMPVDVLVGRRDQKFLELGQLMVEALPTGELTILSGGHSLLLECPHEVGAALTKRQKRLLPCQNQA